MFKGIKNSLNGAKNTTKNVTGTIFDMAKEMINMPWKKLPIMGWAYIIFGLIMFLAIIFVLVPLIN